MPSTLSYRSPSDTQNHEGHGSPLYHGLRPLSSGKREEAQCHYGGGICLQVLRSPVLHLTICVEEHGLGNLKGGTGKFQRLTDFQHMTVTNDFKLALVLLVNELEDGWNSDLPKVRRFCTSLGKKHLPAISDLVTPNSLKGTGFENNLRGGLKVNVETHGRGTAVQTLAQWKVESN